MKKTSLKRIALVALTATIGFTQTGCMGSFKLLTGLYSWNENVNENKVVNNIIFWALNIVPVYGIAGFVDLFILNLIEFWTGSNPVAMGPGDVEEQKINKNGTAYILRATQNKFEVISEETAAAMTMVYTPNNSTWNLETEAGLQPLAQHLENNQVKVFYPNGTTEVFENNNDNLALLKMSTLQFNDLASN